MTTFDLLIRDLESECRAAEESGYRVVNVRAIRDTIARHAAPETLTVTEEDRAVNALRTLNRWMDENPIA